MKLYMVRHTSVGVPAGTCYGFTDVPLADTFTAEAAKVKEQLSALSIGAAYSSPLSRCTKLAAYCGYPSPLTDDRLKEMNFGSWENQLWDDIADPHLATWFAGWQHEQATNGESFQDLCSRVSAFLDELPNNELPVLIFTHAGVIRAAGIALGLINPANAFDFKADYGAVIEFSY